MLTIYERSHYGREAFSCPTTNTKEYKLDDRFLSEKPLRLPEVSEIDIVRHYTELSLKAFGVDNGFYPLGSCTMKYNPKLNEALASLDGFLNIHPLQGEAYSQGALELIYRLSESLCEITGMSAITMQPAAGAHGEYAGLLMIKKYHENNGDTKRTKIIVPDSAHGTNPASASLAGFSIISVPSLEDGCVDIEALRAVCDDTTAGLMLTNPNTLGKFEKNINIIADIVHNAGGLLYYDGANLNAIMGIVRPADMGFDVVHLNLHKTFSTPHGGGGPGAGPVGCVEALSPYLPSPIVVKQGKRYAFYTPQKTIGRLKAFYGNFSVLVKAYAYIVTLGSEGIKDAAQKAVLNANYLKALLKDIDYRKDELCMHEFVLSLNELREKTTVSALDVAKAMIDKGMHPPTMYFPLIVHEALMLEPTETESKETLDNAAKIILDIIFTSYRDPAALHAAPQKSYITRPDEAQAARNPKLRIDLDS